jgi:uncharacterized membrane protein
MDLDRDGYTAGPLRWSQRLSDMVTAFCGSWTFVGAFSAIVAVWVALNSVWLIFGTFDEYPYIALNLLLTVVSTFQGPLIMMSQNRQAERDREAVRGLHAKLDVLQRILEEKADRG